MGTKRAREAVKSAPLLDRATLLIIDSLVTDNPKLGANSGSDIPMNSKKWQTKNQSWSECVGVGVKAHPPDPTPMPSPPRQVSKDPTPYPISGLCPQLRPGFPACQHLGGEAVDCKGLGTKQ